MRVVCENGRGGENCQRSKILDGANSKTIERSEVEEKRASEQTSWVNYRGEDGRIKRGR